MRKQIKKQKKQKQKQNKNDWFGYTNDTGSANMFGQDANRRIIDNPQIL